MASSEQNVTDRQKLALIICNDSYSNPNNRLNVSVKNGNTLSHLLKTIGFNVRTACNINHDEMITCIKEFSKTVTDGGLALFYFSGHGCQVSGKNYMIPVEDHGIKTDRDVEDFANCVDYVLDKLLPRNPSYANILILDCCRSYQLKNFSASNSRTEIQGLHEMEAPHGTLIQFSCNADQTASDELFMKHLLKNIASENVDIRDIFQHISTSVYHESNRSQKPLLMCGLRQEHVYLNEVIQPEEPPEYEVDEITSSEMQPFLKKQEELQAYYDNFPDIDQIMNSNNPDIQQAEHLTHDIMSALPSGNIADKHTACHVLYNLLGNNNQECLFFNSKQGMNLHDAAMNLVDLSFDDRPFVLKLKSLDGISNYRHKPGKEYNMALVNTLDRVIRRKNTDPIIEEIVEKLADAHNVDRKDIILKTVYLGSDSIVYTVRDLTYNVIKKLCKASSKLRAQFHEFKAAKIHPLLYRPSFDIANFDNRGDKAFNTNAQTFEVGPPGRCKQYRQPAGWTRYGLKVLGRYPTDGWLHPFGDPRNWYRAYHGTGNATDKDFQDPDIFVDKQYAPIDAAASIYQNEFQPARKAMHGPGVYCSPEPSYPEQYYVNEVVLNTRQGKKKFKCMLQVAVNPDGVNCATKDIWVIESPRNIRTYGILIKEA